MAPTFRHGKGAVVLFNAVDVSSILTETTVDASVDTAETTTYQKNDKTYIPGMRDGTVSFGGLFDGSTNITDKATFEAQLAGSTQQVITFSPEGYTQALRATLVHGDETKYSVNAPAQDVVKISADVQASDGPRYGKWLHTLGAETTTGASTAVNDGAASTAGAVAHLHVTAFSSTGTATVKVQHSSSSTGWSDLITFTNIGATGFERKTVSGSVKRYVREIRTAVSSTATLTFAVAFARNH